MFVFNAPRWKSSVFAFCFGLAQMPDGYMFWARWLEVGKWRTLFIHCCSLFSTGLSLSLDVFVPLFTVILSYISQSLRRETVWVVQIGSLLHFPRNSQKVQIPGLDLGILIQHIWDGSRYLYFLNTFPGSCTHSVSGTTKKLLISWGGGNYIR